ncbi:hypothetical protein [Haladaptatus sp. CMAA 1911]|uniref:hypothetical protein n=1 Tax=unclassified Haladaptatus TaxID=2622732 RepID=UPI003753FD92
MSQTRMKRLIARIIKEAPIIVEILTPNTDTPPVNDPQKNPVKTHKKAIKVQNISLANERALRQRI